MNLKALSDIKSVCLCLSVSVSVSVSVSASVSLCMMIPILVPYPIWPCVPLDQQLQLPHSGIHPSFKPQRLLPDSH